MGDASRRHHVMYLQKPTIGDLALYVAKEDVNAVRNVSKNVTMLHGFGSEVAYSVPDRALGHARLNVPFMGCLAAG